MAFETAGQAVIDEQIAFAGYLTLNWDEELGEAANVIINAGANFYCQTADIGKVGTESNPSWGSLVQNGGDAHFDWQLVLGDKPYSRGYYTLGGGNVYVHGGQGNDGEMVVGDDGYGRFTQFGGNVYLSPDAPLYLGRESHGSGWYELLSGRLEGFGVYVGYEGTGNFYHASGDHDIRGTLHIGYADGSMGTYTQSGGTLVVESIQIGKEDGSQGTFFMFGGTLDADNILLGFRAGSRAHFTVRSSGDLAIVCVENKISVGSHWGAGTFGVQDGAWVIAGTIEVGDGGDGRFFQGGGTVQAGVEVIGDFGGDGQNALYEHSGGTNSVGVNLFVGGSGSGGVSPPFGRYNLSGSSVLDVGGFLLIGDYGTGEFMYRESTVTVEGGLVLGRDGGTGTYTMPDSASASPALTVAGHAFVGSDADGVGTFSQYNGTHTVGNNLYVGKDASADGTYELQNDAVLDVGGDAYVGFAGKGEFHQTGGTHVIAGNLDVGYAADSDSTYIISGGTLDVAGGAIRVGGDAGGAGAFELNDNATVIADEFILADPGNGSYAIEGGALTVENVHVGFGGGGSMTQSGGSLEATSSIEIGGHEATPWARGSGDYTMTGGTLSALNLLVGEASVGTFTQGDDSGSTVTAAGMTLGRTADGDGAYNLWAGQLTSNGQTIGYRGTGTFNQGGGTNTVSGFLSISVEPGSHGTYDLESGVLTVGALRVGGGPGTDGTFNWQWGTLATATVKVREGGTMNVSNSWTYGGTLEVDGGSLDLNGGTKSLWLDAPGDGAQMAIAAGGSVNSWNLTVGIEGKATVTQTGGTNTVGGLLEVGVGFGSEGIYNLQSGDLGVAGLCVGGFGTGQFNWTGGTMVAETVEVNANGTVDVAVAWPLNGTLGIHGGSVNSTGSSIALGTGGGLMAQGGTGIVEITDGTLTANCLCLGYAGTGIVTQTGGTVTGNILWIGHQGPGDYSYNGGTLAMNTIMVKPTGTLTAMTDWTCSGTLAIQGGAAHFVEGSLTVEGPGDEAQATISDGILATTDLNIGILQPGRFAITDASANVTVSNLLRLGPNSAFSAVPGAGITMTGSDFRNESTDAAALAGLCHLEMTFQGGLMVLDSFEVAGKDLGATMDGCTDNFALGGMLLGDYPEGRVRLDDAFDNQPGWAGAEALYVHRLTVMGGSELNLNGLNLYYLASVIDPDALINENGGSLVPILIPGAAAEMLGVPAPHTVEVTMSQSGDTNRGTFGMAAPGAEGEMRALSCIVEIDADDLDNALEASGEDYFSLVIYYDQQELDVLNIIEDTLRPYWWDGTAWILCGTTTGGEEGEGVFAGFDTSPSDYGLGYCGLDTGADYLWVNLNHASDYGAGGLATPEPATLSLLALGGLALIRRRRK